MQTFIAGKHTYYLDIEFFAIRLLYLSISLLYYKSTIEHDDQDYSKTQSRLISGVVLWLDIMPIYTFSRCRAFEDDGWFTWLIL